MVGYEPSMVLDLLVIAESRIFEIHPFYRTTRLAGGDNTLIVLLSIFVGTVGIEPTTATSSEWNSTAELCTCFSAHSWNRTNLGKSLTPINCYLLHTLSFYD